jgi:hypothetical protein
MAFWIIWMPCWTAAPPVSAEARLGAWKQMMAMRIITTQYLALADDVERRAEEAALIWMT